MIDKEIIVLDENDYLVVEKFKVLGLSHMLSKVLICIYNNICTSKEIEIAANLRQPQVSIAIKKLKKYNYINVVCKLKSVKGRSMNKYGANIPLLKIIEDLEYEAYIKFTYKIEAARNIKNIYKLDG